MTFPRDTVRADRSLTRTAQRRRIAAAVAGVAVLLTVAGCSEQGLLGSDYQKPSQPASTAATSPPSATSTSTAAPTSTTTPPPPASTTSGARPAKSTATKPAPAASQTVVTVDGWTPKVGSRSDLDLTLGGILRDPACGNPIVTAHRYRATWVSWFGDKNWIAQPEYGAVVLDAVQQYTQQCGRTYGEAMYRALEMSAPDILGRIQASGR